jgi:hypothetical protein
MNQRVPTGSPISTITTVPPAPKQEPQHHHAVSNRKSDMDSVQSPRKTTRRAGRRSSLPCVPEVFHGVNSNSSITTSSHVETSAPDKPTHLYTPTGDYPISAMDFLFEVHRRREKVNQSPEKSCPDLEKPSRKELILLVEGLKNETEDW